MDYSVIRMLAMEQFWKEGDIYITPRGGREESGIIYFRDCAAQYTLTGCRPDEEGKFQVAKGGVCYLPHGAEYQCRFCQVDSKGYATAILINFSLTDENGQLFCLEEQAEEISVQNAIRCREQLEQILALSREEQTPPARVKALLLNLLTDLSLDLHQERLTGVGISPPLPQAFYFWSSILPILCPYRIWQTNATSARPAFAGFLRPMPE